MTTPFPFLSLYRIFYDIEAIETLKLYAHFSFDTLILNDTWKILQPVSIHDIGSYRAYFFAKEKKANKISKKSHPL